MTTPIKAKVTELNLHPIAAKQYKRVLLINYGALLFIAYIMQSYNRTYINVQRPDAFESLQYLYEEGVALWADGDLAEHDGTGIYGPTVSFLEVEDFIHLLIKNDYELKVAIKSALYELCKYVDIYINFAPPYTPPSC